MATESEQLTVERAEDTRWVENCIVVPEGSTPELIDVVRTAVAQKAHVDNSDDEAGDDQYMVRFPGSEQELLDRDGISAKIRALLA